MHFLRALAPLWTGQQGKEQTVKALLLPSRNGGLGT